MKKIIMISAFLSVLLAALCLTGCSPAASGSPSGGPSNDAKNIQGQYKGDLSNGSETGSFTFDFSSEYNDSEYSYSAPGYIGAGWLEYVISGSKIEEDKDDKKKFIAEFTEDENKLNVIRFKAAHSVWAGTITIVAE